MLTDDLQPEALADVCRPPAIRIAIVDDHPIVRDALRWSLEEQGDIQVVAQGASGREAIGLARDHALDVLLLDVDMPGQGALDVLPRITARPRSDRMGVLIFSSYPEDLYAVALLRSGARGYLNKSADVGEVATAIRRVAAGGRWVSPRVAELLADELLKPSGDAHRDLSVRELQIFRKLASGHSNASVAEDLSLSPKTVSTYRARLMQKLGARSTSDLTRYALRHRLMD